MQSVICDQLEKAGFDYHSYPELKHTLESESLLDDTFKSLSSDYMFTNYCKEKLKYIQPVPIYINHNDENTSTNVVVGHYVPILSNLRRYIEHDDVWANLQKPQCHNDDVLYDNSNGLHIYSDEFERSECAIVASVFHSVLCKWMLIAYCTHAAWQPFNAVKIFMHAFSSWAVVKPASDFPSMLLQTGIKLNLARTHHGSLERSQTSCAFVSRFRAV